MSERLAVVVFNLGGPDSLEAVEPFLFNLFNDAAIIRLPSPLRWLVARLISKRRAPVAREIYEKLGGRSPLLDLTNDQAAELGETLGDLGEVKVFVAMRYWHPMTTEAAERVRDYDPDRIVLLPLYPQFSTTTTASSLLEWHRAADVAGLGKPSRTICCYADEPGWTAAQADLIQPKLAQAAEAGNPRLLFSAHGLPKRIVDGGDPYAGQVEKTAASVVAELKRRGVDWPGGDWGVCYQSRVGPLEWIGPSTDEEIARAGSDGVPVVVVPIAFVSEHSETLVELDIEYADLAASKGVPAYHRVAAVGTHPPFIEGLSQLVRSALGTDDAVTCGGSDGTRCATDNPHCPYRKQGKKRR